MKFHRKNKRFFFSPAGTWSSLHDISGGILIPLCACVHTLPLSVCLFLVGLAFHQNFVEKMKTGEDIVIKMSLFSSASADTGLI